MNFTTAYNILRGRGWDSYGAIAIVQQLIDDDMLNYMTEEELIALSDDYADR